MYCPKIALKARTYILFFISVLFSLILSAQTKNQREAISSSYNRTKLKALTSSFENEYKYSLKSLKSAQFKIKIDTLHNEAISLYDFGEDDTPLYYTTYNSSGSEVSRANTLHKNGFLNLDLDGLNMRVGVWDAAIALTTHQEFDNRVLNLEGDDAEISDHATMVTGTIISSGVKERAKGVAHKAKVLSYNWIRDKIEVAESAANGLLLSNHSYGINSSNVPDWYFGSYIRISQDWDKIMYNAPYYLMVTAAGNSQRKQHNQNSISGKTQDGFDLLLGFATAKNGLVVAAADAKIDSKGRLKDASVSSYSSFGPIDDGRIKPDLAGDGGSIYSTNASNEKSYDNLIGTSMATPSVTGSLLLLQEYYGELYGSYMKAATLKGLVLHTADDIQEPGPDYKTGWGVINVKHAAEVLKYRDFETIVTEETIDNGQSFSITVQANNKEALMASISWTDPEGKHINQGILNNETPALVNDLDIKITQDNSVFLPWKLEAATASKNAQTGDNRVDPFERIDIQNAEGTYTITVTHKGMLTDEKQDFSLIVTGATLTTCELVPPSNLTLATSNEQSTSWSWGGIEETLYEIQYKKKNATDWNTNLTWDNSMTLAGLEKGTTYQIRLRSFCTQNLASEFSPTFEFDFNGNSTQFEIDQFLTIPEELRLQIFPNPAVSIISISQEVSQNAIYTITTPSGIRIRSEKITKDIDVSNLQSGLYILTVQDSNVFKSSKFFKN